MLLFYIGLLWLIWTKHFSPVTEELFNYRITALTFYQLTPTHNIFEHVFVTAITDQPCDSVDFYYLFYVRLMYAFLTF